MKQTTDADARSEFVDDEIANALDGYGVSAEFNGSAVIGSGEDAYITATVKFDSQTTAKDVAAVSRSLPMVFDKEIDFIGGETLKLTIRLDA